MSKKVKKVIAIGAAIAVPFAAPVIASSIGLSAALGSTIAGSALVGAGLGAAVGGLTSKYVGGGSFRDGLERGAIGGAIGGGISGYFAPTPADSTFGAGMQPSQGALTAGEPSLFTAPEPGISYASTGAEGIYNPYVAETGVFTPATGSFTAGPTSAGLNQAAINASMAGGAGAGTGAGAITGGAGAGTGAGVATTAAEPTFTEALKAQFTNPQNQAQFATQLGVSLGSQALAAKYGGPTSEEKRLMEAQTEATRQASEFQRQQQQQVADENARIRAEQAQRAAELSREAQYYDPEYFGLQRARRAQTAGATAKRAGLRGLTGARREAEARRFDLATARDVGNAFDQGYLTGVQGRLETMQAGLRAMPGERTMPMADYSEANALSNIRQAYADIENRRAQQAQEFSRMFGSFTGGSQSRAT